jgi:hypothetical protein
MTLSATQERDRHYAVTGLIKGAAAVEEIRTLLLNWAPGEDSQTLLARVQASGLLGKATAYRTRDMVVRVFKPRLLTPTDEPARILKQFLSAGGNGQSFREMLLLHEARAEDILYDFICLKFWPAYQTGELWLRLSDALEFLDEAMQRGYVKEKWSASTRTRTAQALIKSLTEFGFLRGTRSQQREIVPYRSTDSGLAYLAYDLHFAGLSDGAVVEHPDWGLFGLERSHLLDRLDALGEMAGLLVQRAGDIVRISWAHPSMESVIHALTQSRN